MTKSTARISFTKQVSETPMPQKDWQSCEDLLAKLVARSIIAEQSETEGQEAELNPTDTESDLSQGVKCYERAA